MAAESPYLVALQDLQKRAEMLAGQPPPLKVREVELLVDDPAKIGVELDEGESSRVMAGLLYGVEPTDAATFAATGALLVVIAAAACLVPARRASAVDPMVALRST